MICTAQKYTQRPPSDLPKEPASLERVLGCVPDALSAFQAPELAQLRGVSRLMQRTVESATEWRALFAEATRIPIAQLPLERPTAAYPTRPQHAPRIDYFRMHQTLCDLRHRHGVMDLIDEAEAPPTPSEGAPTPEARIGGDDIERVRISSALSVLHRGDLSSTHQAQVLQDYAQRLARTCPVDTRNAFTQWVSRLERDALITHLALSQMRMIGLDETVPPKVLAGHVGLGALGCGVVLGLAVAAMRAQGINLSGLAVGVLFVGCLAVAAPMLGGAVYRQHQDDHCLTLEHHLLKNLSDHDCRGCGEAPWRPTSASYSAIAVLA